MAVKLQHLMLATLENTSDPMAWSGSAAEIRRALEGAVEKLTVIDHLRGRKHPLHAALRLSLGTFKNKEPRYPLWMTQPALRSFAKATAAALEKHRPQALVCLSTQCLVYLHEYYKGPAIPIFSYTDTPWMLWLEVYKDFWPYPIGADRYAAREQEAVQRCTGLIYASEWAKNDAVQRFGVPADKITVRPMGAACVPAATEDEIKMAVLARPKDRVNLLFIGKEWDRKGGPLAIEVARQLRDSGLVGDVSLHIVGASPTLQPGDESFVHVLGLLRRSEPVQAARLHGLLLNSHFLVVPTSAECFGLVFAEAQAFGLPSATRRIDALPSIVLDGETGVLLDEEAGAEAYVERLLALLAGDRSAYTEMALAGRRHFNERLNWTAMARGTVQDIEASLPENLASGRDGDRHDYDHDVHAPGFPPPPSHSHVPLHSHNSRIG